MESPQTRNRIGLMLDHHTQGGGFDQPFKDSMAGSEYGSAGNMAFPVQPGFYDSDTGSIITTEA
jgi:hypothetical protein